jgi:hypothetical protein
MCWSWHNPLARWLQRVSADKKLETGRLLTLDMGFNTLDGITSIGLNPLPNRSGAVQGGVSAFIEAIQQSVEESVRKRVPSLSGQYRVPAHLYEQALQKDWGAQVRLSVGPISIKDHVASANARLEQDLSHPRAILCVNPVPKPLI